MKKKQPLWLNIGCGVRLLSGFTNVDVAFSLEDLKEGIRTKSGVYQNAEIQKGAKFVQADAAKLPFKDGSVDYIESCDFLEHLPILKVLDVLREMHRVLRKGGKLNLLTNDFAWCAQAWLDLEKREQEMLERDYFTAHMRIAMHAYGNQIGSHREQHGYAEFHKVPFSPRSVGIFMKQAGFNVRNKKKFSIVVYKEGATPPRLMGRKHSDGVFDCGMIFVQATK